MTETYINQTTTDYLNEADVSDVPTWSVIVENSYVGLVFLIGVPGNALIVYVHKKDHDKTSTDILIAAIVQCLSLYAPVSVHQRGFLLT